MLAAAALVPETVLLIPGAAGSASLLDDLRAEVADVVEGLLATVPERVVVVAATTGTGTTVVTGRALRPTLAAAGVPDDLLTDSPGTLSGADDRSSDGGPGPVRVDDLAAAVGLLLLDRAGWTGPVTLAVVATDEPGALHRLGAALAASDERVAFLLTGSLSARRGPDGPLPDDERAGALDAAVLADLAALGTVAGLGTDGNDAAARLGAVPLGLASELAVSAWGPWQVLLGALARDAAARGPLGGDVRSVSAPFGATYAVLSWGVERR